MSTPRWITAAEVTDEEAGDVQGPDSAVDGNIALFDGTTGKLLKAAGAIPGGGATIDSTTNILIGDGSGNAVDSGKPIGGDFPITLNPGDVLAKDNNGNELIEFGDDAGSHDYVVKTDDLTGYWSVRNNNSTPAGSVDVINAHEDGAIELIALDGFVDSPPGKGIEITTGTGFDDGEDTPQDGGDIIIHLGAGVNGGSAGKVDVRSKLLVRDLFQLDPSSAPTPAEEGMIYAGTDHHLYYYNGTTWKQLDNA